MGQKVHPTGIRLGIVKDHTSVWYAEGEDYANNLHVDLKVRAFIQEVGPGVSQSDRYSSASANCTHHDSHGSSRHCHWQER